jgi:hypothetical protein
MVLTTSAFKNKQIQIHTIAKALDPPAAPGKKGLQKTTNPLYSSLLHIHHLIEYTKGNLEGNVSMGKKSLIKSTAKKKASVKEGEEKTTKKAAPKTKKKAAAKSTSKATAKKTAPKKTAPKKSAAKKAAPKKTAPKKTVAKKTTPAKSKATPKKTKAPKKVSVKDLIFKKFEAFDPRPLPKAAIQKPEPMQVSAPPLITATDTQEVERLRGLLFNKFDMDEIRKAAKEPEPVTAQTETSVDADAITNDHSDPTPQSPSNEPEAGKAYIEIEPNTQTAGKEPMANPVKIALAAAAIIIFLVLAVSYNNASKFYVYPTDKDLEIWRGCFSPKDTQFLVTLPETQIDEPVKAVYTKKEVFPLIYNYYITKADSLLETEGLPDFNSIKRNLDIAKDYVVTSQMNDNVNLRLNNIERMLLLYKASVLLSKNTEESIESAIKLYNRAAKFATNQTQLDVISIKIERAGKQSADLKGQAEQGSQQ